MRLTLTWAVLALVALGAACSPAGLIGGGVYLAVADRGGGGGSGANGPSQATRSPSSITFTTQPQNGIIGAALPSFAVTLLDEQGAVLSEPGVVSITLFPTPASIFGTTIVGASVGVATFSGVRVRATGVFDLTAQCGNLVTTSAAFEITPNIQAIGSSGLLSVPLNSPIGSLTFTKNLDETPMIVNASATFHTTASSGPYTYRLVVDTSNVQSFSIPLNPGGTFQLSHTFTVPAGAHQVQVIYVSGDNGTGQTQVTLNSLTVIEQ